MIVPATPITHVSRCAALASISTCRVCAMSTCPSTSGGAIRTYAAMASAVTRDPVQLGRKEIYDNQSGSRREHLVQQPLPRQPERPSHCRIRQAHRIVPSVPPPLITHTGPDPYHRSSSIDPRPRRNSPCMPACELSSAPGRPAPAYPLARAHVRHPPRSALPEPAPPFAILGNLQILPYLP